MRLKGSFLMSYKDLADAIIAEAFVDYRKLSLFLKKHPDNQLAHKELRRVKNFLLSERYKALTHIDPNYMIKKIDDFVKGEGKTCISVGIS